ncbi:hypothetical protein L1077_26410 [Pseudoalteromonas luteoviolacea]|uniref:hypothetical protein n=1 Tax=Pseudoalteromonas luteoviolacea TaxID=43657 RepID=UPI001F3B330B|nr:hypothetical protein [Pseudoalteromonas luteoviolacea]MCF6442961.1 hypothetical protein [Pseudoalteromonas luteoviolacea]
MNLNEENYKEAENALKDVLYMFVDAIVQSGDFSGLELGQFDPFRFLEVGGSSGKTVFLTDGECDILMKGAAVALLSLLADVYFNDECNAASEKDKVENGVMLNFIASKGQLKPPKHFDYLLKIYNVYKSKQFIMDPYIEQAFDAAFSNEAEFYSAMKEVLENIIKTCFTTLSRFND